MSSTASSIQRQGSVHRPVFRYMQHKSTSSSSVHCTLMLMQYFGFDSAPPPGIDSSHALTFESLDKISLLLGYEILNPPAIAGRPSHFLLDLCFWLLFYKKKKWIIEEYINMAFLLLNKKMNHRNESTIAATCLWNGSHLRLTIALPWFVLII